METEQVKNLYKANGLRDYRLRSTSDLLKVHGVDFKSVNGYNRLDDINRNIFEKFIVNFYNASGLEARSLIVPQGIYFVEDIEYLAKENPKDEHYTVIGGTVLSIDRNGLKSVLHHWHDKEHKDTKGEAQERKEYLRFEYKRGNSEVWQHVIDGGENWY